MADYKKDTVKQDTAEQDTMKQETAEQDTAEQDTVKQEIAEQETTEQDTMKQETVEQDAAKRDTVKKEKEKIAPVGGQAVMEGVMMRGSFGMALAVRDPRGDIRLETYKLNGAKWYRKIPIFRGIAAFLASLITGMKMLTRSIEISSPEEESVGKGGMAIAMILGLLFAVGLFIVVPEVLSGLIRDHLLSGLSVGAKVLIHSVTGGVLRIIIFVLYLLFCSKLKDIRRTFMYHGAEHKTINCYENSIPLTVENIQKCSTVHRRCGTTFLFLVMIISILLFAVANWLFEVLGITFPSNRVVQNLIRMGIKLALLPIVAGCAFEVLKFFAKLPYNTFTKILMAPGLALQKLTTAQPDDGMVEIALKSFNAAMEMENNRNAKELRYPDSRLSDVKEMLVKKLAEIDAEAAEADWILCHVLGVSRLGLSSIDIIKDEDYKNIKDILNKRLERQPLDYVLGNSEFYGLKVVVNDSVLIPRFDTETLVITAIKDIKAIENESRAGDIKAIENESRAGDIKAIENESGAGDKKIANESSAKDIKANEPKVKVLDLCTGSGCIAKAIATFTKARVYAADISKAALEVAKINLAEENCIIIESDLFEGISEKFDFIVCNPPYIRTDEIEKLAIEVTVQPRLALDGGEDGLDFYKKIAKLAPSHLNEGGVLILEIGHEQGAQVSSLLCGEFKDISIIKDLSGSDRVVRAVLK